MLPFRLEALRMAVVFASPIVTSQCFLLCKGRNYEEPALLNPNPSVLLLASQNDVISFPETDNPASIVHQSINPSIVCYIKVCLRWFSSEQARGYRYVCCSPTPYPFLLLPCSRLASTQNTDTNSVLNCSSFILLPPYIVPIEHVLLAGVLRDDDHNHDDSVSQYFQNRSVCTDAQPPLGVALCRDERERSETIDRTLAGVHHGTAADHRTSISSISH